MPAKLILFKDGHAVAEDYPPEQGLDKEDVVFAVYSDDDQLCIAVAEAISDVHDIWIKGTRPPKSAHKDSHIRPKDNWGPEFDLLKRQLEKSEYVYAYANSQCANAGKVCPDDIFYVGRGIKTRMYDHLPEAFNTQTKDDELTKLERIRKEAKSLCSPEPTTQDPMSEGKKLVHQIARFDGKYREAQTDAVEKFLISYWQGVYQLTNLTRGNMSGGSARWVVRPQAVDKDSPAWLGAVEAICTGKSNTQKQQMHLLAEEISKCFKWEKLVEGLVRPERFTPHKVGFVTNGTDAHAEFLLRDKNDVDLFKVQLRLSLIIVGVCVNLRPLPKEHSAFGEKIGRYFGAEAAKRVRAKGTGVYFKPFADNSRKKAQDVYFNFSDLSVKDPPVKNCVNHADWLGIQPGSQLTLPEVIDVLIKRIDSV